jgi:hypothetical protein
MAFIYRSMFRDGDKPAVGPSASKLGVRVSPAETYDIAVNAKGNVSPKTGGMSVAPSWRDLPFFRIPKRLKPIFRDAAGDNRFCCWRLGDVQFVEGPLLDRLFLRIDTAQHGVVEPSVTVPLDTYISALAATRDRWIIDES